MSDIFINVCRTLSLMWKVIGMISLQLLMALIRFNKKVIVEDVRIIVSLTFCSIFLIGEFLFTTGRFIGIAIRQNEEEFNFIYNKYLAYFKDLYTSFDKSARQMYSLQDLLSLKLNT